MSIKFTYKGELTDTLADHIKLNTAGKYLEGDVEIEAEGGATATVVVTAPTGSTVTMTKGATTKTATEVSGTWTFTIGFEEVGVWTVNASLGTKSKTETVSVTEATEYLVTITYGRLPEGYTEVECIHSTNLSVMTIPFNADNSYFEIKTKVSLEKNNAQIIATSSGDRNSFGCWWGLDGRFGAYIGSSRMALPAQYTSGEIVDISVKNVNNQYTGLINGQTYSGNCNFATMTYIYFGAPCVGDIYETVCNNGVDKLHIVPCISPQNIVGMYDLEKNVFRQHDEGAQPFTAGGIVQ